jgi:DNA-binding transcriptional LysR family regulator
VLGEGGYACLVDRASLQEGEQSLSLEAFVAREHLLVSSGGFIGITDEGLAGLGLRRRVCASTTHFAALPFLLKGSQAVATIPGHAAKAIAALGGLALLPCPLALPRYPIELGWRTHTPMEPAASKVREAIVVTFA